MKNFTFCNPVKIVFGAGEISQLSQLIPANARVLMTYGGGSIKKNGVYDQVMQSLGHIKVTEFGGIEPNPDYSHLLKAVAICQQEKINFILAVGGGSVIDATKFIAAAVNFPLEDKWQILDGQSNKIINAIPYGAILTLPATGSEMNHGSVISYREKGRKKAFQHDLVYPKFAILDPKLTYSLPARQLANGIVDPFIHVTEQYLTTFLDSKVQDEFAESILRTLIKVGPDVINLDPNANSSDKSFNEKVYNTRANWMWAATNALNGTLSLGVDSDWATHMIGHELTALYNLDHAQTLAIVSLSLWRYKKEAKIRKLLKFARNVWGITNKDIDEAIKESIDKTEEFFKSIGMKTRFSDYNLTIDPAKVADNVLKTCGGPVGEHKDIDRNAIIQILEDAY